MIMMSLFTERKAGRRILVSVLVLLGLIARVWVATMGGNYDLESYGIVAEIMENGGNVYGETYRYNYGPLWFYLLSLINEISKLQLVSFEMGISLLLTAGDMIIFWWLFKHFNLLTGMIFWLNPISIIISGYHRQFDNLAIAVGMIGVWLYQHPRVKSLDVRVITSGLIIGVSLVLKHVLFVFPVFMAMRAQKLIYRVVWVLLPASVFSFSFIPYLDSYPGIKANVFEYDSWNNGVLYQYFPWVSSLMDIRLAMMMLLVVMGYLVRKLPAHEQLIWYCGGLFLFASAITNQYLVMGAIFAVTKRNPFTWAFLLYGGYHLMVDKHGLNYDGWWREVGDLVYSPSIAYEALWWLFVLGVMWVIFDTSKGRALLVRKISLKVG